MPVPKSPSKNKRIRRTPEEARRLILEAAEAGMAASGPAGLRLEAVAKAAGVSHPTILHHFGSREGLIQALNGKTVEQLKSVLLGVLNSQPDSSDDAVAATFAAYRDGLAQRVIWLLQSGQPMAAQGLPVFDEMVEALHAFRLSWAGPHPRFDSEDTRAIVHLTTIAAFGDAIIGARLRRANDEKAEARLSARFEHWFGEMLNVYIRQTG